jgi:3-oxoacyl-[acyl-carrier-protein] synthase II
LLETSTNDVVITGLSAISAAGIGTDPLLDAIRRGESLLQPVPEEVLGEAGHRWGKAEAFRAADFMPHLEARNFDRSTLLAVVAAGMALKDADIDAASPDATRIGLVLGCGVGGTSNADESLRGYLTSGTEGQDPMLFPDVVPNASASNASIEHKLKGPSVTVIERFCSAEAAFLMAHRFLEEDRADVILTGGVDELFPALLRRLKRVGLLRSFGSSFGEGAGILVLEKGEHARRRSARVRATVGRMTTIGRFYPETVEAGMERLLPEPFSAGLVSLSGTATSDKWLLSRLPDTPRLDIGPIVGRSFAMGGLAMATLVLMLEPEGRGLHLASSPEGPYYAIDIRGGVR